MQTLEYCSHHHSTVQKSGLESRTRSVCGEISHRDFGGLRKSERDRKGEGKAEEISGAFGSEKHGE